MQTTVAKKGDESIEAAATDEALRRFIGYRLKRAYNTIRADLLIRLEPLGLRITTFSALLLIVDHPGIRQSALAKLLDIKSSNMVAIIDDLEQQNWVSRERVPEDRRAFGLYATRSGKSTYEKAIALGTEHESKILDCLGDKELRQFSDLLAKIETSVG